MSNINQYPEESLIFQDQDFYDIDWWNDATQEFETKKILGSTIKAGIQNGAEKRIDVFNANQMISPFNQTWSGVSNIGPASISNINGRYDLRTYGHLGQPNGSYMNTIVPTYFVEDNTIRIEVVFTSNAVGTAVFQVGLTVPNLDNFGGEVQTIYQTAQVSLLGGFKFTKVVFNYATADLLIGDPIAVVLFRHFAQVNDDLNDDAYVYAVNVEQT